MFKRARAQVSVTEDFGVEDEIRGDVVTHCAHIFIVDWVPFFVAFSEHHLSSVVPNFVSETFRKRIHFEYSRQLTL